MIIDTHSHLDFSSFDKDRDEVIKRTQKEGLVFVNVGVNYETSQKSVKLANQNDNIYAAIGLHPEDVEKEEFDYENYKKLALSNNKIVAIGEIGLDYKFFSPKQKPIFEEQLKLARELNLPVIIHCRQAHQDLINILKKYKITGTVHCFTGSLDEMKQYLELGFYIGFNGIIFKQNLDQAINECPLDKMLAETDCPFLAPPATATKRNEPVFAKYVLEHIAKIRNMDYEKIEETTTQNARKLFKI